MLLDSSARDGSEGVVGDGVDWWIVDRSLRAIASKRAALDADEARWLREAERCQVWRKLGMVSAFDYMERVLGYAPRTAQERLRVARALGTLPLLNEVLGKGGLSFSAIRELTRVATPSTEAAWCDAAIGKNLRQIEELVADHRPGDRPEDPKDPEARMHVVRLEVSASTFALLRQARAVLEQEHGRYLTDDELTAAMCHAVIGRGEASEPEASGQESAPSGRARYQIAMVICERCRQGWQEAAGVRVAVDAATVEQAACDAQYVGSLEGGTPERAHQDVAPAVVRFVWRRDGGRCRIPGCRSSRGLEIHHIEHREHGGGHEPSNLILACSACHTAHHHGLLRISGNAEQLQVERVAETAATAAQGDGEGVGAPTWAPVKLELAVLKTQAKDALVKLGWKPTIATLAVTEAIAAVGPSATLEQILLESLHRCPRPVRVQ